MTHMPRFPEGTTFSVDDEVTRKTFSDLLGALNAVTDGALGETQRTVHLCGKQTAELTTSYDRHLEAWSLDDLRRAAASCGKAHNEALRATTSGEEPAMTLPSFPAGAVFAVTEDDFAATGHPATIRYRDLATALDAMRTATGDARLIVRSGDLPGIEVGSPRDLDAIAACCWRAHSEAHATTHDAATEAA